VLLSLIPGWRYIPIKSNSELSDLVDTIKSVVDKLIEEKRSQKEPSQQVDLLDLLIQATDEDTGVKFTSNQLHNNVMTFLLAGHETTSVAMSWLVRFDQY
jgi:cytochrome P450